MIQYPYKPQIRTTTDDDSLISLSSILTAPASQLFVYLAEDVAPITSIEEHQSQHISRSESRAASVFTPVPLLITSGLRGGKILGRHIPERLSNFEMTLNNLVTAVNVIGQQLNGICAQLKPIKKTLKIVNNNTALNTRTINISPLRSPASSTPKSTTTKTTNKNSKIFLYNGINLMTLKTDMTSSRSFMRKVIMTIYNKEEILEAKHLDKNDERFQVVNGQLLFESSSAKIIVRIFLLF
ncbi:unnamed protein product [Didymodactylos carnosus]|uniref:Uncharacterized protein n=1 Tax=Didymodactylos carnosus TaxID=1234261 RepID=A0A8S2SI34_9BILA|nr:unnamed protein product [Didymodactylos carnosus]CAF4222253.1 unnamed protein product [Didymodactylos carnosus]